MTKSILETVCVHITGSCDLSCRHCFSRYPKYSLDMESLVSCLYLLRQIGLKHISLSGGEPTTYKKIANLIKKLEKPFSITITTNGNCQKRIRKLLGTNKEKLRIRISLDGTKNAHEKIRGLQTYEKVLKSIATVKQLFGWVGVNTVLHIDLKNCFFDLANLLNSMSVDHWAIMTLIETKNDNIRPVMNEEEIKEMVCELAKRFNNEISIWDYYNYPHTYLLIRETGEIVIPGNELDDDIHVGDIHACNLSEIGNIIKEFRKKHHYFDWQGNLFSIAT